MPILSVRELWEAAVVKSITHTEKYHPDFLAIKNLSSKILTLLSTLYFVF